MAKKLIPDTEKIYELRRDARVPNGYWRSGMRKTHKEWAKEFSTSHLTLWNDWFIDCSKIEEPDSTNELYQLVKDVFEKKGLHSITYKEAACEVAELWLKQNQSK